VAINPALCSFTVEKTYKAGRYQALRFGFAVICRREALSEDCFGRDIALIFPTRLDPPRTCRNANRTTQDLDIVVDIDIKVHY
jgi:hypothetical protein